MKRTTLQGKIDKEIWDIEYMEEQQAYVGQSLSMKEIYASFRNDMQTLLDYLTQNELSVEQVREKFHSIKGMAGFVGGRKLEQLAIQGMEQNAREQTIEIMALMWDTLELMDEYAKIGILPQPKQEDSDGR